MIKEFELVVLRSPGRLIAFHNNSKLPIQQSQFQGYSLFTLRKNKEQRKTVAGEKMAEEGECTQRESVCTK